MAKILQSVLSLVMVLNHVQVFARTPQINQSGQLTIDEIKKQYPNATIKIVSAEELNHYKELYAQNSAPPPPPQKPFNPCEYARGGSDSSKDISPESGIGDPGIGNWNFNTYGSGSSSSSGKDFLIFVAVVGVVIVAALVVYSIGYLMTMAASGFECKAWSDFGVRFSYIEDNSKTQLRRGNFTGLYYSLGYIVPAGIMGLTAELGGHDFKMHIKETNEDKNFVGTYFMAGPSFSIPFERLGGHAFQIELLAGTSTEKGIGLMSTLRFGIELKMASHFSLGLNLGAALVNIKDFDNYIKDDDQLNFLSGVGSSYRW